VSVTTNKGNAGYSILELMLAVVLLGTILTAIGLSARSASNMYRESQFEHELEAQLHRSLEFIAAHLTVAGRGLTPEPNTAFGTSALTFNQCEGYDGEAISWSQPYQIAMQLEDGELDDGIDNNGNGLVDEGVIVFVDDAGSATAKETVKCHRVRELLAGEDFNGQDDHGNGLIDEPGLCFDVEGNVLTIFLTLEGIDPDGRIVTKTDQTAVRIRN
jgi:type II secretory pathway pseudopilin PulG